ncbi:hypothetical protein MKW98_023775, partial [Papaver atlanticum]
LHPFQGSGVCMQRLSVKSVPAGLSTTCRPWRHYRVHALNFRVSMGLIFEISALKLGCLQSVFNLGSQSGVLQQLGYGGPFPQTLFKGFPFLTSNLNQVETRGVDTMMNVQTCTTALSFIDSIIYTLGFMYVLLSGQQKRINLVIQIYTSAGEDKIWVLAAYKREKQDYQLKDKRKWLEELTDFQYRLLEHGIDGKY